MAIVSSHPVNRKPLGYAMSGFNPGFGLPANYGFPELAQYEEERRRAFGPYAQQAIQGYGADIGLKGQALQEKLRQNVLARQKAVEDYVGGYGQRSALQRANLAQSLTDLGSRTFSQANPAILEDLNRRGLLTSQNAVAQEQGNLLKDIALRNQERLLEREASDTAQEERLRQLGLEAGLTGEESELEKELFGRQADISGQGLTAQLQAEQDALDAGMDLRRGQLEAMMGAQKEARDAALAQELASQSGRNQLYGSLIGAGGSLLGGGLAGGLFGGGGAGGAAGAAGAGGAAGAAGGLGGLGGLAAIGGAGIGAAALSKEAEKRGGTIGGIVANPIGYQLNKAKSVVRNVFCFDGNTKIDMDDGTQLPICNLEVGSLTKGGRVVSVRKSETANGTRYRYKGIVVTGSHAVREDGKWLRIKDSEYSEAVLGTGIVWSISTDKHRIHIDGLTFADDLETDDYEKLSIDESLKALNEQEQPEFVGVI